MKKIMFLIMLIILSKTFATEYAQGTLYFKTQSELKNFVYDSKDLVKSNQQWFNSLSDKYSIFEIKHLFKYVPEKSLENYYSIMFPETTNLEDVYQDFENEIEVIDVHRDVNLEILSVPNESNNGYYDYQWYLDVINAEQAWDNDVSSEDPIIIACIDSGVDIMDPSDPSQTINVHPDLAGKLLTDSSGNLIMYNAFDETLPEPAYDDIGHGTHVAGLISASTNNNQGIASLGAESNIKIFPLKVTKNSPSGGVYAFGIRLVDCIFYSTYNEYGIVADIVNMSVGSQKDLNENLLDHEYLTDLVQMALSNNVSLGCINIASAGNDNRDYALHFPGFLEDVITVGASDFYDKKTYYSSFGENLSVVAPGGTGNLNTSILSTTPIHDNYSYHYDIHHLGYWDEDNDGTYEDYDCLNGTSMSAPIVSSLMAMLKAKFPTYTNEELTIQL